jgi:RNA polymerase primary sigma factor/RNA polymerase sporulation-specific sigma factor
MISNEELAKMYQQGNKAALDEIIENNKGVVFKLANKYYTSYTNSIDREDLEQEGFIGLIIAAERYDFEKSNRAQFITYAVYWVNHKINRFIQYRNTNNEISLNKVVDSESESETEFGELLDASKFGYEGVEEQFCRKQLRKELEEVMKENTSLREREIIKLLYGWYDNECMFIKEVGDLFCIAPFNVKNTRNKALLKMRNSKWGRLRRLEKSLERSCISPYSRDAGEVACTKIK